MPRLPSSCGSSRSTLPLIAAIEPEPFNSRTTKLIRDRSLILHGIRRKRPEELIFSTRQSRLTISPSQSMPHTLAGKQSLSRGLSLRSRPLLGKLQTSGLRKGRCPSSTSLALCSNTAAIRGKILRPLSWGANTIESDRKCNNGGLCPFGWQVLGNFFGRILPGA